MKTREFRAFVDRFEGDKAVLLLGEEERYTVILPAACLPEEAREGAVLTIAIRYEPELTQAASDEISALIRKLSEQ